MLMRVESRLELRENLSFRQKTREKDPSAPASGASLKKRELPCVLGSSLLAASSDLCLT